MQSAPGAGSTFKVRLPFVLLPAGSKAVASPSEVAGLSCVVVGAAGRASREAEADRVAVGTLAAIVPSREEALRQGRLVLIAEDNETNQKVIVRHGHGRLPQQAFTAGRTESGAA